VKSTGLFVVQRCQRHSKNSRMAQRDNEDAKPLDSAQRDVAGAPQSHITDFLARFAPVVLLPQQSCKKLPSASSNPWQISL
jgi:hypothetical protein